MHLKWSNKLFILHYFNVDAFRDWCGPLAGDCLSTAPPIVVDFLEGENGIVVYLGTGVNCSAVSGIWMVKVIFKCFHSHDK